MNKKLSASLLGLGALTSVMLVNLSPVSAQTGNGSNNGNNLSAITFPGSITPPGVIVPPIPAPPSFSPGNVSPTVLNAITLGNVTPLIGGLVPSGLAPDGPTRQAVAVLADTVPGIVSNGNINPVRLQAAVNAYNNYVRSLVAEVGPVRALAVLSPDQQALRETLINLIGALPR